MAKKNWGPSNPLYRYLQKKRKGKKVSTHKRGHKNKMRKHKGRKGFAKNYGFLGGLVAAGAYGASREWLSVKIAPLTSKIPMGNISDEVGMMGVAYLAKRFVGKKVPFVANIANAAMIIEAARVGSAIASGQLSLGNASSATSGVF
jgi:hypothetical protein